MRRRRRVWSEDLPFDELGRSTVIGLLAERSIGLIVAVQPDARRGVRTLLRSCAHHGVEVAVWPLLDDGEGRWPSDANTGAFRGHLLRLLDELATSEDRPIEVVFDLEPPIAAARRALALRLWDGRVDLRPANIERAAAQFHELVTEVVSRGLEATAVVPPMLVLDPPNAAGGWQRMLGTPVADLPFARVTVMAYTSLFEGYSRGALARRDARALLARLCREAVRRWGSRASAALGVVGGGALGDELPYRVPAELADDVAIARSTGLEDLSLYGLTGVLSRRPADRWLDAFVRTDPAPVLPAPTLRSRATWAAGWTAGRAFELACAVTRPPPRGGR
jgi:hypothetical protein